MRTDRIKKALQRFTFHIIHMSPEKVTDEAIFIFPGAGYSHFGPILYYPTQWMLENNKAVIIADYDFRSFNESADLNRVDALNFCIKECLKFALEKYPNGKFSFLGKSIGTQALCCIESEAIKINFSLVDSKFIWLTPVWNREKYLEYMINFKNKSLYIIGDNDPQYTSSSCQKIRSNSNAEVIVLERADHSLDNDLNVEETFQIHREVFDQICNFLR